MIKTWAHFLLTGMLCSFQTCIGAIIVDSVHTTVSTCPNNGTATIYAQSTRQGAVFLYNITSGPVTYPQQNDSTFASLFPGTYTAWVHDINSFDSTETTFTITGNYLTPNFTIVDTPPTCINSSDGYIICNLQSSTGLAPFTWQITSPYIGSPQSSGTFTGLSSGTYTVKLTDACLVSREGIVTIDTGGFGLNLTPNYWLTFIGCDTAVLRMQVNVNSHYHGSPLTITAVTDSGTSSNKELPVYYLTGDSSYFYLYDTIYKMNYDQYLYACISDTCGGSVCIPYTRVAPYGFELYAVNTTINCVTGIGFQIYGFDYENLINAYPGFPVTVIVTGANTHTVVDSFMYTTGSTIIPPLDTNQQYVVTIYDHCGNSFSTNLAAQASPPLSVTMQQGYISSLDSTGSVQFSFNGFSPDITLSITSGPAVAQSTKYLYAYRDTIEYPDSISRVSGTEIVLANLAAGTYTYTARDTCGHVLTGTFLDTVVNSFHLTNQIVNGCLGRDSLNIDFYGGGSPSGTLDSLNGASVPFNYIYSPIYLNEAIAADAFPVYPGTYLFDIQYGYLLTYGTDSWQFYWTQNGVTIHDTIIVPPYNDSIIKATGEATCGNTSYIYIVVDSNHGVLPFQYEILTGPQTFALQDSPTFTIQDFGTYTVGVQDACGDVDTRQVTIDTGRFIPVIQSGGWCAGTQVDLSDVVSPYFTYIWHQPNGSVYTGDTLVINPFLASDTGNYVVAKIVDINGCRDTTFGNYYLVFKDTFEQNLYFCQGDTVHFGGQNFTSDTVLYDTLTGAYGCDSIIVTSISRLSPSITQVGNTLYAQPPGISYQWFLGGQIIPGATSATYTPTQSGTYNVFITYEGCGSASLNYTFVYNSVSNLPTAAAQLRIEPNPTHQFASVLLDAASAGAHVHIALYDILGNRLAEVFNGQTTVSSNSFLLDLSSYAEGVYLLRAEVNGNAITCKVLRD